MTWLACPAVQPVKSVLEGIGSTLVDPTSSRSTAVMSQDLHRAGRPSGLDVTAALDGMISALNTYGGDLDEVLILVANGHDVLAGREAALDVQVRVRSDWH